jgi:hypothetical protein
MKPSMYFAESLENEYEQELSERFRRGIVDGGPSILLSKRSRD